MLDVIIALLPVLVAAVFLFGPQVLVVVAVTISACVFFEIASRLILRRDISSVFDLSAVITGLMLALTLPVNVPLWKAVVCSAVAIAMSTG
jgi:electron transport complex protein RnfD